MKDLKEAVCADLAKRLRFAELSIAHCLDQLPDADVWWRPAEGQNSVGNLVLHVCGAMRQLIVAGVGGAADDRQRQAEFAERGPIETDLLKRRVAETVAASREVIERADSSDLLATRRRAQGTSTTVLSDLLTAAHHSSEHAAQIVYLTHMRLGDRYRPAY